MYRHRLRPVVACLIMWYRCISVMLLFSFEMWKKKKSIKNSWSIIISGDLLRLLRYIKVPLTTQQRLRVFVPGRKECLYSACSRSLRAWWLPSSRRREVVVSSLRDRPVKRSNQCKYFHFFYFLIVHWILIYGFSVFSSHSLSLPMHVDAWWKIISRNTFKF